MALATETVELRVQRRRNAYCAETRHYTVAAAGDTTPWVLAAGGVGVQLGGAATAVTAVVERSSRDPAGTANPVAADVTPITGNPSTGIPFELYDEPGVAWWRVRVPVLTGGSVDVAITAGGAE